MKQLGILLVLSLGLSVANAADKETKRAPASPDGAVMGMPIMPGSGMPPGAVGLPMPKPDASCRRAASMRAVNEALEDADSNTDCHVYDIDAEKEYKQYRVVVRCATNIEKPEEAEQTTYTVKTRLKNKKTKTCKVMSAVETHQQ